MAVTWIHGSNEALVKEAVDAFIEKASGKVLHRVRQPRSKSVLEKLLQRRSLTEIVYIIEGISYLKQWKEIGAFLKSLHVDVAVVTVKDSWELKDSIYTQLKKVAEDIACPGIKPFGVHPPKYIIDRGKVHGVAISPTLAWGIYACTGVNTLRIENEVKKCAYLGESVELDLRSEALLFRYKVGSVDFEALLFGKFETFVRSCDGVEPVELLWRLIDKFFQYVEHKIYIETQGGLRGKVSKAKEKMIFSICSGRSMESLDAGIAALARLIPVVRELKLESLIYGALYGWAKA